jgi:hypothetical protein
MGLCPIPPAEVQAAAQQQLAQAMARPLQIFAGIVTRPARIPDRFVFRRRRPHFREQPRAVQFRQLARISAIRLDPLTGLDDHV